MELQIVQTKDDSFEGYVRRYVFGLNLLPDNHLNSGSVRDPRLTFLRELARQQSVSVLVDKASDHILDPEPLLKDWNYKEVPIGVIGGDFIKLYRTLTQASSMLFIQVEDVFFDITYSNEEGAEESLIFNVIYDDCLAFFVLSSERNAGSNLAEFLAKPFSSSDEFIAKATKVCEIVITSNADGDFFGCYAKDISKFEIFDKPLDTAVTEINETIWFQESKNDLVWDGRYSMCLVKKG